MRCEPSGYRYEVCTEWIPVVSAEGLCCLATRLPVHPAGLERTTLFRERNASSPYYHTQSNSAPSRSKPSLALTLSPTQPPYLQVSQLSTIFSRVTMSPWPGPSLCVPATHAAPQ